MPALILALLLVLGHPPPSQYVHHRVSVLDRDGDAVATTIKVRARGAARFLWSRTFSGSIAAFWSEDRRAIAIFDSEWRLTTWRAGERVVRREVGFPDGFGEPPAYEERHRWSPDNRRVMLLIPPTQGSVVLDDGWVLIVNVATGAREFLDDVNAFRVEWAGARTIRYWGEKRIQDGEEAYWEEFGPVLKRVR